MTRYSYVAHNVGDLPRPRATSMIEDYLDAVAPDCVVLSEGEGYRSLVTRAGYRTRVARANPGTFILVGVREDHRIVSASQMPMKRTWQGPKRDIQRPPRRYPLVTWEPESGLRHDVFGVHFPFDGPNGVNAASWRESAQRIEDRWALRSQRSQPRHIVALGDWNGLREQLAKFINPHAAQLLPDPLKVDHMLASDSLEFVNGRRLAETEAHPPYLWVVKDAA